MVGFQIPRKVNESIFHDFIILRDTRTYLIKVVLPTFIELFTNISMFFIQFCQFFTKFGLHFRPSITIFIALEKEWDQQNGSQADTQKQVTPYLERKKDDRILAKIII